MAHIAKVILFSAGEHLPIANAIKTNLSRHPIEVRIWDEMVFRLAETALDSLVNEVSNYDFAIAVINPTADILDREIKARAPRDNIVFEVGLAIGLIGRHRTFMVHEALHPPKLPTDLVGVTTARYQVHSADEVALISALRVKCEEIAHEIRRRGPRILPAHIELFGNRAELQKASKFDEALSRSRKFDLVTFSGQFLRDYKPELEKALLRGTIIRILAYDDGPETATYYDALARSLRLGSGEDKRKEVRELREYVSSIIKSNPEFKDLIQVRFIRNDLLLYNLWLSTEANGRKTAHLTMYFHGRDAPSFRVTGNESAVFETVEREFLNLWGESVEIVD